MREVRRKRKRTGNNQKWCWSGGMESERKEDDTKRGRK